MQILENFYRAYHKKVFPKINHFKGVYSLNKVAEELLFSNKVNLKGIEIELNSTDQSLEEHLYNIIDGYTKKRQIQEGDLVLDLGAYPGEFTVYAAKNGADVVAAEPNNANLEELKQIIKKNGVEEKVNLVNKAVWKNEGEQIGFENDADTSKVAESGDNLVETTTINTLIDRFGCFDFIKMDIEGAELEILENADLQNCKPHFAIASYHLVNREETWIKLEKILKQRGYSHIETGFDDHKTTWASR